MCVHLSVLSSWRPWPAGCHGRQRQHRCRLPPCFLSEQEAELGTLRVESESAAGGGGGGSVLGVEPGAWPGAGLAPTSADCHCNPVGKKDI